MPGTAIAMAEETEFEAHRALVCIEKEKLGRHFGSWEQIADPEWVFRK